MIPGVKSSRHVPELDGVRGFACFGVLISHCLLGIAGYDQGSWPQDIWFTLQYFLLGGVDLFFVLSGFLIGGILIDQRGSGNFFVAFWTRRAGRILPVLFILVASYSVILALRPHINAPFLGLWLLKEPVHSPLWYLTFTQTIPFTMQDWGPRWMGITWSLAIEEQFYLFFPLIVYFLSPRRLTVLLISFVVLAFVSRGLVHHYVRWEVSYFLLPCRLDCLSLGVLGAIIVRHQRLLARLIDYRLFVDIAIVGLALLISRNVFYSWDTQLRAVSPLAGHMAFTLFYSAIALFFALCILRIFLYPRGWYHRILTWKPLTWLGLISYGLYMYHQSVNGLVHGLLFGGEPRVDAWQQGLAALLVMTIAISLAALSFYFVETPIRKAVQRVKFRPSAAPANQLTKAVRLSTMAKAD